MSHVKNKVEWCLKKALKEVGEGGKHRGLVKVEPSMENAREHIGKSEHYLEASLKLEKEISDISASTLFYSAYHSLLAILAKFGYESGNQECTFAFIYSLIEDRKIDLSKDLVNSIVLDRESVVGLRERFQYGVELSMKNELFNGCVDVVKKILGGAKDVVEK